MSLTTSINPSIAASVQSHLQTLLYEYQTETFLPDKISKSQLIQLASATLAIISNENILATATNSGALSQATQQISNQLEVIHEINEFNNLYGTDLNFGGNVFFTVVMGLCLIGHLLLLGITRSYWFGISFTIGSILEFLGYLGRSLGVHSTSNFNYFLLQIICLTIAPSFIMAGIYYLLAQLCVVYGPHYSVLKPMWYSYIFICCDIISIAVQAVGGGIAGEALYLYKSTAPGSNTMVAGIAFQVFSMSLFICFWFDFILKIYNPTDTASSHSDSNLGSNSSSDPIPNSNSKSISIFTKVKITIRHLFNYKISNENFNSLEFNYSPDFKSTREKLKFKYLPLLITISILLIYTRCIYRVIELSEGWTGNLITHEAYVFSLDASMVFLTLVGYLIIHPGFVLKNVDLMSSRLKKSLEKIESLYEIDLAEAKQAENVDV